MEHFIKKNPSIFGLTARQFKERQRLNETLSARCPINSQRYFHEVMSEPRINRTLLTMSRKFLEPRKFQRERSSLVTSFRATFTYSRFFSFLRERANSSLSISLATARQRILLLLCGDGRIRSLPNGYISSAYQLSGWIRFLGTKSYRAFSTSAE